MAARLISSLIYAHFFSPYPFFQLYQKNQKGRAAVLPILEKILPTELRFEPDV